MKKSHVVSVLPSDYSLAQQIDLAQDKKLFIKINVLSLIMLFIAVALTMIPFVSSPVMQGHFTFAPPDGIPIFLWLLTIFLVVVCALLACIFIHELIHALFFKLFSGGKIKFGVELKKGMVYAACPGYYFDRFSYTITGLAPLVLYSLVLYILMFLTSGLLFAFFSMVFIFNVSGASGDALVCWYLLKIKDPIFVADTQGTAMEIYAKQTGSE